MSSKGSKGAPEQEIQRVRSSGTWQGCRDPPGSFLAKGGGQGWDPLVGRPGWSADWWAPTPTSSFVQSLLGNFVKAVWGA